MMGLALGLRVVMHLQMEDVRRAIVPEKDPVRPEPVMPYLPRTSPL